MLNSNPYHYHVSRFKSIVLALRYAIHLDSLGNVWIIVWLSHLWVPIKSRHVILCFMRYMYEHCVTVQIIHSINLEPLMTGLCQTQCIFFQTLPRLHSAARRTVSFKFLLWKWCNFIFSYAWILYDLGRIVFCTYDMIRSFINWGKVYAM